MNSIYTKAHPSVLKLFERAGSPRKVLCAPLDFAKSSHAVLFCNGMGDILKKPFHVPNSQEGIDKLLSELKATCHHRKIKNTHVLFGGEDTPAYADNFVAALMKRGFLVTRVNAYDAKQQREKFNASTDFLDLNGIAHCLLKGRAGVLANSPDLHAKLRLLVREREFLVQASTAAKNRLHTHVDRLFPGFLNYEKSRIKPYSPACYWLLQNRFSAPQIARRDSAKLVAGLKTNRVRNPEKIAEHLQAFAKAALPPDPLMASIEQCAMQALLSSLLAVRSSINTMELQIAELLAQSPGARLTTIPGIKLALAAGLTTEIFSMGQIPSLDRICSYAGIVPRTTQSGGPDKPAHHRAPFTGFNPKLKNYLLQAGEHMSLVPGTDAYHLLQQTKEKGQHTTRVLGKHAAAVVRSLLLNERTYLPQKLYHPDSAADHRAAYIQQYWPKLRAKWAGTVPLQQLFDPNNPLGRWRKAAQEAYQISLPLHGSKDDTSDQQEDSSTEENDNPGNTELN